MRCMQVDGPPYAIFINGAEQNVYECILSLTTHIISNTDTLFRNIGTIIHNSKFVPDIVKAYIENELNTYSCCSRLL